MNRTILLLMSVVACSRNAPPRPKDAAARPKDAATARDSGAGASLPLVLVADVDLPGKAVRFDYQDLDVATGHLVIAHMNDDSVVVVNTSDGSLVRVLDGIHTPRGVVVAADAGRIFVTSMPHTLVVIDSASLAEVARVDTGNGPDGVAWDPTDKIVGVSDQRDGAVSLIAESGDGKRTQVPLGHETGNVVFDASRGVFWVTVVKKTGPAELVAVDPLVGKATTTIALPGCSGAHGLRIHPDGSSALIACEDAAKIMRVDLAGDRDPELAPCGDGPDVIAIDPGLEWLYVSAESGDLTVFDLAQPGLVTIDTEHVGDHGHTVAVDPTSHHVFFPLVAGPDGTPILRIMKPAA